MSKRAQSEDISKSQGLRKLQAEKKTTKQTRSYSVDQIDTVSAPPYLRPFLLLTLIRLKILPNLLNQTFNLFSFLPPLSILILGFPLFWIFSATNPRCYHLCTISETFSSTCRASMRATKMSRTTRVSAEGGVPRAALIDSRRALTSLVAWAAKTVTQMTNKSDR